MDKLMFNFRTQQYDSGVIITDDNVSDYMMQSPAAIGMYKCYRSLGLSVIESYMNVLLACVGQKPEFKIPNVDSD